MLRHHRTCPNFPKKCTALLELAIIIIEYFGFWSLEIFQKILLLVEHLKSGHSFGCYVNIQQGGQKQLGRTNDVSWKPDRINNFQRARFVMLLLDLSILSVRSIS